MCNVHCTDNSVNTNLQSIDQGGIALSKALHFTHVYSTMILELHSFKEFLSFHYAMKNSFAVELTAPNETIFIKQGEFFIAKPNAVYTIKTNDSKVSSIISLHIKNDKFLSEYYNLLNDKGALHSFLNTAEEYVANPNFSYIPEHEQKLFVSLLDIVNSKELSRKLESEDFLALTLKSIILLIDRNFTYNRLNLTTIDRIIKRYIIEHLQTANVTELAHMLNYSVNYTSELVSKVTGKGFKALLQEERMRKAKTLLIEQHVRLEDVYQELGYFNAGSFIFAFKKIYGETPGAFRDKHSKDKLDS